MPIYDPSAMAAFSKPFRNGFINSLGGFKSLLLIGSRNARGETNLAPFSSFFHIGAEPPLFGIIFRPVPAESNTLQNILTTKMFTVNHVLADFYTRAHQCAAHYPAAVSEFPATGLEEYYLPGIAAPFVKESRVKFAAEFREQTTLAINGTTLLIAEIKLVSVPADCVQADGFIDLEKAGTVTCSGLDSYHLTSRLSRLTYPKTDTIPYIVDLPRD